MRSAAVAASLAAAAVASGCGSNDGGSQAAQQESASPQRALAEVGRTRDLLDQALAKLRAGNRAAAAKQVGTAYLEHYEKVEGPLGDVAPKLNEALEEGISRKLRTKIKSGAKVSEVAALLKEIRANLAAAERRLG